MGPIIEKDPVLPVVKYWVKIRTGKQQALAETVYYKTDMFPAFFLRWLWWFKAKEAKIRLENPRWFTEISHGHYDWVAPVELQIKVLTDKIRNRKARLTEYNTKVRMAEQNWTELFPIQDDELYKKAIAKITRLQSEKEALEAELLTLTQNQQS